MRIPRFLQCFTTAARFAKPGLALVLLGCQPTPVDETDTGTSENRRQVVVFAAASSTNAVQEIGQLYEAIASTRVIHAFAASSTLARQIELGAPADLYLSANPQWMDHLESAGHLVETTRRDLLENRIVLIAPADRFSPALELNPDADLAALLGADGRLAMGDPTHVPAGMYGKQALESLGLWAGLAHRIAPMAHTRAALTMVERGETPLGIVYATDAAISKHVQIVGLFPADAHSPVCYPIALVDGANIAEARRFLAFLETPEAQQVFRKHGFTLAD